MRGLDPRIHVLSREGNADVDGRDNPRALRPGGGHDGLGEELA